jgi:hypothetical protein
VRIKIDRIFSAFIPILISWVGTASSAAKVDDALFDPPIRAHTMIYVKQYDAKSSTYDVDIVDEPYVGPNIASTDDLCSAIHSLNLSKIKSDPRSIVGQEFSTDRELLLLSEDGVKARVTRLHKAK